LRLQRKQFGKGLITQYSTHKHSKSPSKTTYGQFESIRQKQRANNKSNDIIKIFSKGIFTQRSNKEQEKKIKLQGKNIYIKQANYTFSKPKQNYEVKNRGRSSKNLGFKYSSTSSLNKRTKVLTIHKKDASTGDYGNQIHNEEGSDSDGYTDMADIYCNDILRK